MMSYWKWMRMNSTCKIIECFIFIIYRRDFLLEREEFIKYDLEIDTIADNADHIAKDNIKKYEEL